MTTARGKFCTNIAMAALIVIGTVAPMTPLKADAETLYDIIQRRQAARAGGRQLNPNSPRPPAHSNTRSRSQPPPSLEERRPVQRVVIARPKIFDYKPEKLVEVNFSDLDFQKTATITQEAGQEEAIFETDDGSRHLTYVAGLQIEGSIAKALRVHYAANPTLIWSKTGRLMPKADQVIALLARADEEGLNPQDYQITRPDETLEGEDWHQALANFDVTLSAYALRYAMDIHSGRVVANKISAYHDLPRHDVDFAALLQELATSATPAALLEQQAPQSDWYVALKMALAEIREQQHEAPIPLPANMVLRPGQSHETLPQIIALIKKQATADYLEQYGELLARHASATTYDTELKPAIVAFQQSAGKAGDGVVGPATIAALQGVSNTLKEQRLMMAMERLRWLPRDFSSRYVFINQPAYQAQYFEDHVEKFNMRTVVGSPNNQTYFFYDKISLVTFNPSWGVPRSIIFNEMMPKILADPSYLTRNGYEVYGASGKKIDPYDVDWESVATTGSGVNIRQKPGPGNSLGELKILFPNKHDIYLHDTPSKRLFSRDMRALSHGCIRLEDPRKMAAAVMGTQQQELKRYFGTTADRSVSVNDKVPVFLTYFTAWPDAKNGKIHYYDDVYGRDKLLEKANQKITKARLGA